MQRLPLRFRGASPAVPAAFRRSSSHTRRSASLGCGLLLLALAGCGDNAFAPELNAEGTSPVEYTLAVSPAKSALASGQTVHLKSSGGSTTWTSSAPKVATVDANGTVTALSAGTATITAVEKENNGKGKTKKGTSEIVVTEPESEPESSEPAPTPAPSTGSAAELPRVYVDTRFVAPTGATIRVAAGGDLQGAINAANAGDQILLQSGATYTGNFVLPRKSGTGYVTIRTETTLPAEGTRVSPATATGFAKIVSPNVAPAIATARNADFYRIVGVEITVASSQTLNYGVVRVDSHETTDPALQSNNIILDRVYVHGHSTLNLSRCVELHGAHNAVIDSYLAQCHGKGYDTQAILSYNGTGPFKIVNNYLEGAGENIMFGGSDTRIQNNVPSDIEIRGNHLFKPLSWKGVWTVKNLFELKNARRVLVEGNVMENNWTDGQTGFGVLFTPRNQDGSNPWAAVQDVTFRHNIVRNSEKGINVLGKDYINASEVTSRIRIENNLFTHGWTNIILMGGVDIQVVHNTTLGAAQVILFDGPQVSGLVYRDNLSHHGEYGIFGSGAGVGLSALDKYAPGYLVQGNLFFAGERFSASSYPASTMYSATMDGVGFMNFAGGDYRLSSTSSYRGKASDGTDPGADFSVLNSKTSGVVR